MKSARSTALLKKPAAAPAPAPAAVGKDEKKQAMALQKMFSTKPMGARDLKLPNEVAVAWTKLGALKIEDAIKERKLKLDTGLNIAKAAKCNINEKSYIIFGQ